MVLRVGDARLVGVGTRSPHWFQRLYWSLLMARWIDSKLMHYFLYIELWKTDKTSRDRVGQGRAGSEVRGVLLVPSSSPTLPPIYDGLDVVVLRVGDAWLVGVGKRAPHGFRCPCLVSPHGSLDRLYIISSTLNSKNRQNRPLAHGSAGQSKVEQIEQVVRCGASCLSHHRHLHYRPSMMALT